MMKRNRLICLVLIYAIFPQFLVRSVPAQEETSETVEKKKGLQFRLSEGVAQAPKNEPRKIAQAARLSDAEAAAIIRRLPEMTEEPGDRTEFAKRAESLPPPRAGKIVPIKFPAEEKLPPPAPAREISAAPIAIVRTAPNGSVEFVKDLSITFSQPMVAVSSQSKTAETVPIELTPKIDGKWRWLGTNTLIFDAKGRFPMATKFTARVAAGTRSATGGVLEKDFSWNFETPPPQIESFEPDGEMVRRDAMVIAKFNQRIDRAEVFSKISATSGGQKIPLRPASDAEIASDKKIFETIKTLPENYVVFRADGLWPFDAQVIVNFEPGIPSAEGGKVSVLPYNFAFKTFGALKLTDSACGYSDSRADCEAYESWRIDFNNPLDAKSFDKSLVKIEPPLENPEISVEGSQIEIRGCCRETRRTYKVKISEKLRDVFGQTLGRQASTEFKIGARDASLYLQSPNDSDFITLDPNSKPVLPVYSVNYKKLKVKLYAVKPESYESFYWLKKDESRPESRLAAEYYRAAQAKRIASIGQLVFDKTIKVKSKRDLDAETKINLGPALTNNLGHAILVVEPDVLTEENKDQQILTWLEITQLGIDAFADYEQLTVYASELKNGKPLKDVQLQISNGGRGVTNENGLGAIELPFTDDFKGDWLIARNGADAAILVGNNYYYRDKKWSYRTQPDDLRWFVFDDRKMYRPGETVSIKGYIRKVTGGKIADIEELGSVVRDLNYVLQDSRGNDVLKGKADLNVFGAFDFRLQIPDNVNLGTQTLRLSTQSQFKTADFAHNFQVQEFRRPEFEVTAKSESAAPFYVGGKATLSVEAKYYAGGGLADAATNWTVRSTPTSYTPPNRDDFTFGKFVPWWTNGDDDDDDYAARTVETFKGVTDANGKHFLAVDFVSASAPRPYLLSAEARVQDVNRQAFASSTELLVHPSELYVGLRTAQTFVAKDEVFKIETITTDIDGNAVADVPVSIVAELKAWEQINGEWQEVTIDTQNCQIRSARDVAACEFKAQQGGQFTITATVADAKGRRSESELNVWVAGAKREPVRGVEQESIEMIPDKRDYAPGETARILINTPFFPAEGVLTLRRNGVVRTEHFTMNEASTVLQIPIEERFVPNLQAQVDLFGASKRIVFENELDEKLPKRPAFASGALDLDVSLASRKLTIAAEPAEKTLEPGGETSVNVAVTDHLGKPSANTEVALVAVDESVLALTNYRIENPVDAFYRNFEPGTSDYYSREKILLANVEDLLGTEKIARLEDGRGFGYGEGSGDGMGAGSGGGVGDGDSGVFSNLEIITSLQRPPKTPARPDEIRMRKNFDALAIFSPSVKTDADGRATVKINLPDNLTRYRITAIAVTNSKKFGKTESAVTARQSLMVRPSAPRFLNFGDKAELPVVVQNQTDQPLTVDVAIRAANANLPDGNGRRVTIPANDRAELRFPVAVEKAGTARFQVGAVSGSLADAAEFSFPVWTPATSEAFATYGTTDQAGAITQLITPPTDVYPQFGALEVTTSSTQLQELTDAFIYLQSYPFECSEQISSRILSVAALRDVLQAFKSKDLPTKEAIEAKMASDIARLEKLQHGDGGFSFWSARDESLPYVSVHVAHALARAKQKGYSVPSNLSSGLLRYLKNIESNYPQYYSSESQRAISSYALYVRDLMGEKDAAKAQKLIAAAKMENLSAESLGWLLPVFAGDQNSSAQIGEIKRVLLNRVTETAGAAHFVTKYKDGEYVLLASDRRADGVILEGLLKVRESETTSPDLDDLIPKLVRGLLGSRTKGRWRNTQENAFVLLALDKYFHTFERVTPNFVARVWLGQNFAGEQKFAGRSIDSQAISIPMSYLQKTPAGTQNLILDKQGEGRLYYRIGMKYAPRNLNLSAADYGFAVTRAYEAIDDPQDVRQNSDGSWIVKSGARVRVRIRMIAPTRRYHVALVDNLPAGFEIINAALAVSESVPEDESMPSVRNGYYYPKWYDHQNLRDERAEVFKALLYEGTWTYTYVARATTPGDFVAAPAKAEEMYAPETFGRSRTDFVSVK